MSKHSTDTAPLTPSPQSLADRYERQIALMQMAGRLMSSGEAVETVLKTILAQILNQLDYQAVQIYRLSPSGKDLWLYLEEGAGLKPVTQNIDLFSIEEDNIISHAAAQGQPVYTADLEKGTYSYFSQNIDAPILSELAVPMLAGGSCLGVLRIQSRYKNAFSSAEQNFFTGLADLLAGFVKNNQTIGTLLDNLQEVNILYNLQREESINRYFSHPQTTPHGFAWTAGQTQAAPLSQEPSPELLTIAQKTDSPTLHGTELVAPIKLHEHTIGLLGIQPDNDTPEWDQDDLSLLDEVSNQVALALENAQLLQQTRARTQELSILFETSRRLTEATTPNEIYQILAGQVLQFLQADYGGVWLLNKERTHLFQQIRKNRSRQNGKTQIADAPPSTQQLAVDEMPAWQKIVAKPAPVVESLSDESGVYTRLLLPLEIRDNLLGVVLVKHRQQARRFTENELKLAQAIVTQAAVAIEKAQAIQTTELTLAETRRLYEISRALVESANLEETFNVILENVKIYNIDRVSISLLDKDSAGKIKKVTIAASWDRDSARILPVGTEVSSDNFPLVEAFATPPFIPMISEDLTRPDRQDKRMDENFRQMMVNKLNAVTLFSAPMYLGREYKGVLSISTRKPHTYTEQEQRIYQTLADQAIIAIERHRLLEETRQSLFYSEILSNLSQRLLMAETPQAIYDLTLKAIAATNPERGAVMFLFDPESEGAYFKITAIWDNPSQQWPKLPVGTRYAVTDLQMRPLLSQGQTVIARKVSESKEISAPMRHALKELKVDSFVAVPIWQNRQVGGFVIITYPRPYTFSPELVRLYEDIARLASGALETRRLFNEVTHRATQLQTATEVSQATTGQLDLNTLLTQSVNLVRDRFGFYHASIFLVDEYRKYAVIQASTGKVGRKMLKMQHKLAVGGKSIVGTAVDTGKPHIALDVGKDAVHFNNPLLPNTRSEMAVPLIVRGQVIGALDVQSTKANAFSESDIAILQSLANQLANTIEAARAYQATQTALAEVSKLQEQYSRTEWTDFVKTRQKAAGYRLTSDGFIPVHHHNELASDTRQVIQQALEQKQPVVRAKSEGNGQSATPSLTSAQPVSLAAPLALQEQVPLGVIDFETYDEHLNDEDTLKIVEAVARQAAQAIQTARLFEQTRVAQAEAESLFRLSRALVTAQNRQQMFDATLKEFLGTLGLKQGGILLFEPGRRSGKLHALYREGKPVDTNLRIPIAGNPSYQKLIETRQPVVIEDFATDPLVEPVRQIDLGHQIASLLLTPIIIDGEVVGSIGADSVEKIHRFSERDINMATTMADQLAIALQNRRLLEETQARAKELQKTAQQLQEIDRLKTQFLANMSHELRTPLNSIIGFSRVILKGIDGPLTELQKADLTSIYNSGQHLLSLINNILDISKIEAGKMELNFEEVEVGPIIKGVMSTAIALVKDKPITLHQETPETLPPVWADPTRLRQVILNLVSNACKFTEKGHITVKTTVTDENLVVSVTDTGIGIEPEKLEDIFEEFTQVDASTTRKAGGTGLGLPISRYFIEMHGGKIEVDSTLGQGSTFTLSIPLNGNRAVQTDDHPSYRQEVFSVVALEPDSGVTNLYHRYLSKRGYKLITLNIKSEQDILAGIKEHNPDAILLETIMPNQDGWQILKTLKQDAYTRDIPVVVCSISSDQNRSLSLGATDHLTKPIVEGELLGSLQQIFSQQQKQTRVLVIDDHADDVLLIRRILEADNFYVSEAATGKEGLDLAVQRRPDLIILDLTMPEMDGFTVIESLKNNPQTRNIPVIIVSAREISAEENEFLTGRIEVLLNKGAFTEQELLAVVKQALA